LSGANWDPELIDRSWSSAESFDAGRLSGLANVAEYLSSGPNRGELFSALVDSAVSDMSLWGVVPLGVIPCGFGALTVAVRCGGTDMVGKRFVEPEAAEVQIRAATLFVAAALGPDVVASSRRGLLTSRVRPGTPLRSLQPGLRTVRRAAALLPTIRSLDWGSLAELASPAARMVERAEAAAADDDDDDGDGFTARYLEFSKRALERVDGQNMFGHGDLQFGNILAGPSASWYVIDAEPVRDPGYYDAVRMCVGAAIDAVASGAQWDVGRSVREVAVIAGLDPEVAAVVARARLAETARYIKRCVAGRDSEWRAADVLCNELTS